MRNLRAAAAILSLAGALLAPRAAARAEPAHSEREKYELSHQKAVQAQDQKNLKQAQEDEKRTFYVRMSTERSDFGKKQAAERRALDKELSGKSAEERTRRRKDLAARQKQVRHEFEAQQKARWRQFYASQGEQRGVERRRGRQEREQIRANQAIEREDEKAGRGGTR